MHAFAAYDNYRFSFGNTVIRSGGPYVVIDFHFPAHIVRGCRHDYNSSLSHYGVRNRRRWRFRSPEAAIQQKCRDYRRNCYDYCYYGRNPRKQQIRSKHTYQSENRKNGSRNQHKCPRRKCLDYKEHYTDYQKNNGYSKRVHAGTTANPFLKDCNATVCDAFQNKNKKPDREEARTGSKRFDGYGIDFILRPKASFR